MGEMIVCNDDENGGSRCVVWLVGFGDVGPR